MQNIKLNCSIAIAVIGIAFLSSHALAENSDGTTEDNVSFRSDVMPVFFRAGCNSGTCHGSARGKDGFMLSLFGYDPKGDYHRVVNEMYGRRVNVAVPEKSLLLLKSIGGVAHTGGKLFDKDSEYYDTLYRWIAAGAPDDEGKIPETVDVQLSQERIVFEKTGEQVQLRVTAIADDGSSRDVTTLARFHSNNTSVATIDPDGKITTVGPGDTYVFARFSRFSVGAEVIILPPAEGFQWPSPSTNNYIDELVFDRLEKLRIAPSDLCDDETFLRRVTLDLIGRPPTVDEYVAFAENSSPDKRSQKIDELIAKDDFADLWTSIWAEQLRVVGGNYAPFGTHLRAANTYYEWIRTQLRNDRPLNEFVSEMITASGSNLINGPANLYTMMQHNPRFEPKSFAADFSQVFLGVQIQCAECHNHPFDRWTMDDYYGFVSFFVGMKRKPGVEPRERRIYFDTATPPARHIVDNRPMPAKTLGAVLPVEHDGDPRPELAQWLTSPDNELFSQNLANRIWAKMMGRGIVEPVDDVRVSNPPSNGPLLKALSEHLVASNFQLRSLVRDICNSRVYQLSNQPNTSNKLDTRQFSHSYLRRLRADVLMDSVVSVTGMERGFSWYPSETRAIDVYPRTGGATSGPQFADSFFNTFGSSSRQTICACEISKEPTLSQTLHLSVGDTIGPRLRASGRVKQIVDSSATVDEALEQLFILALSRRPTAEETHELRTMIGDQEKNVAYYEDILWGLLNSTEFAFNH
ncbi:Bacterial Ig-like domain (group 2) [Calycomorphotria hydatis]|uniref:Bacterial Ig-like domain (Group 2) n=2 Tax=Calycomorphotria hydatis TaxID=2528027 RepID=A0A517T996_9PLAN|nr:Bacterial Ig-like domain (group 2) [Calycomorphotria hydatis]